MRTGSIQKLQSEPAQQERGATSNSFEQTTAKAARPPERDTASRQSEAPTSDISTAVERKNDTGEPERRSIERKHAVREQPKRQSATPAPPADARPSATSLEHPNDTADYEPLMGALGTTNREFAKGLFEELFHASARGDDKVDRQALFLPLAVLKGTKPKDELDAMHVVQMATINMAIIRLSGELAQVTNAPHLEVVTRAINQLARTYTAQLEAHKRYCSGGEQTTVNVSVTEGGQAIVGNVNQSAHGVPPDGLTNSTPALTDARQPAMDIIGESERVPVPLRKNSKT